MCTPVMLLTDTHGRVFVVVVVVVNVRTIRLMLAHTYYTHTKYRARQNVLNAASCPPSQLANASALYIIEQHGIDSHELCMTICDAHKMRVIRLRMKLNSGMRTMIDERHKMRWVSESLNHIVRVCVLRSNNNYTTV